MTSNISPGKQKIHPTAIIDPEAKLGEGVEAGPYVVVEGGAEIGEGTHLMAHAYVSRYTTIGKNCNIFVGATLGTDPQHLKFNPSTYTRLQIGDGNIIREYVTIHRASIENHATIVGDNNLLMAQSHIGHDCVIGSRVTIANAAMLGGHVEIGDNVFVSGGVPIHQFVRIGKYAMLSGWSAVSMDVPPFMILQGPNTVRALNVIGLTRGGFSNPEVAQLRLAHKILYRSNLSVIDAVTQLEKEEDPFGHMKLLVDFIRSSKRGICKSHNSVSK